MNLTKASEIRDILVQHLSRGEIEVGIAFFKQNSDGLPDEFRLECLGNISFYQRDIAKAIKFYEAATLISPEHVIPRYLYLAGVKNEREGNLVDAFKYYHAAIEAETSFVDPYVELGGLLMKIEDFEGALRCYEDAVSLSPEEVSNYENLKIVLIKLNEKYPGLYKEKLKAVTASYEQLTKGKLKSPPEDHHW